LTSPLKRPVVPLSGKTIPACLKADWIRIRVGDGAHRRSRLLAPFWPLTIAQLHTRAAAVFVDEFDAGCL
jgi:hypothetical protein